MANTSTTMELVNIPNRNVKEKRMANTIESVLMGRFSIDETRSSMGVMMSELLIADAAMVDVVGVVVVAIAAVVIVMIEITITV